MRNRTICFFIICALVHFNNVLLAQNVGIGTITPTEKLDVNGNVKADTLKPNALQLISNAGTGKILMSDGTGNATWENMNMQNTENIGYGVWGDCATNGNITEYYPVADTSGVAGDFFGNNVSLSGDFAIVGSPTDDESSNNQGSVTIFHLNGNSWEHMQKLTDPDALAGDNFGTSVSISGNFALVGSFGDDETFNGQGSAIIYQFNGINWEWLQKITDPDGASNDGFGYSVSISGNYAIVGSYADNVEVNSDQGSASIFQYNGTDWEWMEKIVDSNGEPTDNFGISVAISENYAIIGSYLDDVAPNQNQGSASVYMYNGANWILMQKLTDSSGEASDYFGQSVSISGTYAVIGSPGDNLTFADQGSVSVFRYNGSNWISMPKTTSVTGLANDGFGTSVSVSGNYMLVGAYHDDVGLIGNQGSAILYQRLGNGWQLVQNIIDPAGNENDLFGLTCALDMSTRRFLIGASGYMSNSGKAVFGKIN